MLQRYGVSDDDAFAVGLTCGGIIDIFVESIDQQTFPELGEVADDIRAGRPVAVATLISGVADDRLGRRLVVRPDAVTGTLGSDRLDAAVGDDARACCAQGRTGIVHYGPDGERRGDDIAVFVASYAPRPRMIVFGAIDFAAAVARVGAFLGYRVTVCDARPTFATQEALPRRRRGRRRLAAPLPRPQTEVDERTVVCVLTHDPKFDVPLLEMALRLPLALRRRDGLAAHPRRPRPAGCASSASPTPSWPGCTRPIGLDVGARTPEETAVSIAAEIIAQRWGGTGAQLRHDRRADPPRTRRVRRLTRSGSSYEPSPTPSPGDRFGTGFGTQASEAR